MMIAEAAIEMGHTCIVLDPAHDAPAFAICGGAERNIVAKFDDTEALEKLCAQCDVTTYEFENIPAKILEPLCKKYNIKQGCAQLLDSQDRLREKENAQKNGLPTQRYMAVNDAESLRAAVETIGLPAVLKTRTMGYDGKGQAILRNKQEVEELIAKNDIITVPTILEEFVNYDYEVSIIMVRDRETTTIFPIGQNIHRRGVLDICVVPAKMNDTLKSNIERSAQTFMERCGYYGILTIELFITENGANFIFNEMAPRPHNSGHYTIEGCNGGSQFTELVRYLTDQPLRGATLRGSSIIMKNILGEDMAAAEELKKEAQQSGWRGCYVHLYGKSENKIGRKTAHITFTNTTLDDYKTKWAERFLE